MFDVIETDRRFQLRMSATLEGIDEADDRLAAFLESREVPVDLFAVRIIVRESMLNAVTHGAGKHAARIVHAELDVHANNVVLTVTDPGPGFPWAERTGDIDVLGDGGRGLALMKIYADDISFNPKGNQVTLRKDFKTVPAVCGEQVKDGSEE